MNISPHKRLIWENYTELLLPLQSSKALTLGRLKTVSRFARLSAMVDIIIIITTVRPYIYLGLYCLKCVCMFVYIRAKRLRSRGFCRRIKSPRISWNELLYDDGRLRWKSFVFCYQLSTGPFIIQPFRKTTSSKTCSSLILFCSCQPY